MKYLEGPELYYLLGGALAAFLMAVMRSFQYTRKQFALRLVEAFMCSMLTASFAVSLNAFWELSYVWAIPAGTVIGFLGTDLIHGVIVSVLEAYATRQAGVTHFDFRSSQRRGSFAQYPSRPMRPRTRNAGSHLSASASPDNPDE